METFGVAVFLGRAWFDVEGLHVDSGQPLSDVAGDELGPVVSADEFGEASCLEQFGQSINDILAGDAAVDFQSQTLSGELVHDRQPLQSRSAGCPIKDEVPAPDVVAAFGFPSMTSVVCRSLSTLLSLLLRDFQPFSTP